MKLSDAGFRAILAVGVCIVAGCSEKGGGGGGNAKYPLAGTTWIVEKSYYNGEEQTPQGTEKVIFRDDFNQVNFPEFMGNYTMSPTSSPKLMVVTIASAEGAGDVISCIWDRDGDQLKIAYYRFRNKGRPDDFTPKPGDEMYLLVLKKSK